MIGIITTCNPVASVAENGDICREWLYVSYSPSGKVENWELRYYYDSRYDFTLSGRATQSKEQEQYSSKFRVDLN